MHTIQSINDLGMPRPWRELIHEPSAIELQQTSKLLENVQNDKGQLRLERLAHGDPSLIGRFFGACPSPSPPCRNHLMV